MPMPSSGIIVVEKPPSSTASNSRITTTNTSNSSNTTNRHHPPHNHQHIHHHHQPQHHPPTQQKQQQHQQQKQQQSTHIQYYEYYDANENQQLSSQQQQQQKQQQHSSIVVDGSIFQNQAQSQTTQQQQAIQLGGGRKLHTTTLSTITPTSTTSSALASASASSSSSALTSLLSTTTKPNLHIQAIKAGPMPQITKQLPQQQQQIIQHTSHTTANATTSSSSSHSQPQQQLHHQPSQQQHVQQVHLATTSTAQHQHPSHHHHHHHQQQQPPTQHQAHMIQVPEEFLEQAQVQAQNHTTASHMMISATGEVIQQQQIFKIVSTDAATGNMIIDTSGANAAPNATATSKVLLSNLTVLSKQQAGATAAALSAAGQQQQSSATGQTINFVNAKQLYTAASSAANPASSAGVVAANLGKQQKFTVASASLGGNFKTAALKQTSNTTQYVHQTTGSQPKISMTSGNRGMQMLTTTTRMQNACNSLNHTGVIAGSPATAQTMVLQQPHKFVTTSNAITKSALGPGGNVIKKTAGTLRMSNNNTAATKLMNNLHAQTAQGVKTFITQTTASAQQQLQNNPNHLSAMQQQHHTKGGGGGKSKFVKQYNNAILNSAGAVAIATLPHQQQQQHHQNTINSSSQQQQHQQTMQAAQTTYMNHHKATGQTKINKINSKYSTANVAAQLPPGTQLHQKTLVQAAQQQQTTAQSYQGTNNSNIKFVNAQGTIIQQQQPLTPQKIHIKQQQQPQYQSLQSFDAVDGNTIYSSQQQQQHPTTNTTTEVNSSAFGPNGNSSLLTDDIMMVNGTQMTDEISARILQSMSQKSFINQRYQQLHHQSPVFQKSPTNSSGNNNMLPPSQAAANAAASAASQQSASSSHTQNAPNNHSNILLSPREYTLYPPVGSSQTQQQQQQPPSPQQPSQAPSSASSPNHYSNTSSANGGSLTASSAANYLSNSMATITPHSASVVGGGVSGIGGSSASSRLAQSAPNSRSQSMERKLHESSISRKSTEYYKVNIKDYHQKCTFVAPTAATIYATNASSLTAATSLIDFIIPLPSCTSITTTNTLIAAAAVSTTVNTTNTNNTSNFATMTTTITSSKNYNNNNHNSNHNSLRGSHSNLATTAQSGVGAAHTGSATNIAASASTTPSSSLSSSSSPSPMSSSVASASASATSTLMGSGIQGTTLLPRSPSIPPPSVMMEPQAQVIHLQATKTLVVGANHASNDDEDIIGVEVRPVPVETNDIRLQILHAVLLDHTYANPMPLELPTTFAVQLPTASHSNATPGQHMSVSAATGLGGATGVQSQHQQWSLGGIGAVTATSGPVASSVNAAANVAASNYPMYSSQLSRLQQDDDAYSAISGSSRIVVGEIDPGEETETAPEAEAEDDSITRCICDLTHDDGYMICCDKCCAWQHVDCMGIDRQNIPDEYLCEVCQPRPVDKARARSLQVQKRKEQTQLMLAQAQAAVAAGTMGAAGSASGSGGSANQANLLPNDVLAVQQRLAAGVSGFSLSGNNPSDATGLRLMASSGTNMKKGTKILKKVKESATGKKSKKAEKLAAGGSGLAGKAARKETKKNTKRKKSAHEGGSTAGMTAAEKHAANLRQWIESYELAVTNHYSPELRARLQAMAKQPSLLQSILNTENPVLKEFSTGNLENRATTVPHAGGKILISNLDITPNSPICELRGKYMLTTQYKTQNTAVNMNTPPPNNYHVASYKAHKTPGPFIFFYQLQGAEVIGNQGMAQTSTTTTLNPDGTYTTTTTTLPAQLSPPTYLKGPEISVDTRTYGNEARFVRRSCRPNAEIQHLFEKGTIHLFIVALTDIRASTEITIRHEPHDLLAVDTKKSNAIVIQPTSTPCACGLSKDCIFGPPLPQLPPAAKSNAGRKSVALNGGSSGTGNLTAKQRKANQQNLNRNRSTSSSGDSNMGGSSVMAPIPTVALSLNSPNNLLGAKMCKNPTGNNTAATALLPLTASCNSNLSNASSSSSMLTSIMHDSGICTSSSSPSVSIPSPTQHMHSPIQQAPHQQQQHQQHHPQQPLQQQQQQPQQQHPRTVQIVPQQQQQQLMASLPTPLILTTDVQQPPSHPQPQPLQQHPLQPLQQQVLLQSPQHQLQPPQQLQQQPLTVIAQAATLSIQETEKQPQPVEQTQENVYITSPQQQQQQLISQQQLQPPPIPLQSCSVEVVAPSQEANEAAPPLESFNCAALPSNLTSAVMDTAQQPQMVVIPSTDQAVEEPHQPPPPQTIPSATLAEGETLQPHQFVSAAIASTEQPMTAATGSVSLVCSSANSSPHQQKSPQKNNQSQQNNSHAGRKTPAKQARTASFSEDNDQHNDENAVSATPNSSSTPKEKPKLSREDRKMEAILRAIEKMERNQQRKNEQKHTKRQNSSSHNTTPTSPNKTLDSADSSGTKRSSSQSAGGPTRTKKKRKAGNRGAAHSNQRKRRQSRMNSQESIEGCDPHANDTVTSESDGCATIHSPPIQTLASLKHSPAAISETAPIACETVPNNVDQAAGLLMAFANPNVNAIEQSTAAEPQSPERPPQSAQYMISPRENTASPPTTPSPQVSSACLLIEAAVGPLESNLEPNLEPNSADIINAEFKYPLQAKTKKLLMNNWLHQTEETSASVSLEEPAPSQLACATGGLDSLVQAAMNDFKQTQSEETISQPQNLSIVAQRVEEFIQQTEGGPSTPPPTKHSYEYEQQQQQMYVMTSPAVDLSLKQPSVAQATKPAGDSKNFNLPLQVSTCSNNSSVKKRWLRQAISEETHEEAQSNYSMSPSPTAPVLSATNNYVNPQLQTVANPIGSPLPALTTNNIPNGFTTPLKKRRLLLTDNDDEENVAQNSGDFNPSTPLSPPPVEATTLQQDTSVINEYEMKPQIAQPALALPAHDAQEDVDVDVEKCEQHEHSQEQGTTSAELEQEQDVDVISPPLDEEVKTEVVTKHEPDMDMQEEDHHAPQVPTIQSAPAEFHDQEDDVDILRSPSPGREMIKAEDNLVKIEPEDTSGADDVKIDVEREESMAADDVMVPPLKRECKEETIPEPTPAALKVEQVEVKLEHKTESTADDDVRNNAGVNESQSVAKAEYSGETKVESPSIKEEEQLDEMAEPKSKRLKLEEHLQTEHKSVIVKGETRQQNENLKQENSEVVAIKQEVLTPKETIKSEKLRNESEEVSSSSSIAARNVTKVAADSTFSSVDSATPPLPIQPQPIRICASSVATPSLQRNKALSDDDIQARLHNFHKENILFLQSRNKKSKSSNSTSSSNSLVGSEHHRNNNKNNSSSSSTNHHHHHDGKDKSVKTDKSSSKHHKNSSSSSSGSSKKPKLHKRERTTSSSSSSNSHKNSTSQITSTLTGTKNAVVNSSTNSLSSASSSSSSSSKKIKSLKKSSSGSSTSSTNSISSSAPQTCHPSSVDSKDSKHQRQRTISSSSTTTNATPASASVSQSLFVTSKKRQLNFELELTKDMHLVNSVVTSSGKHKRLEEGQGLSLAKKSRKESSVAPKEEQKNGTNKSHKSTSGHVEKTQEKEKKSSAVNVAITSSSAPARPSHITSSVPQSATLNVTTAIYPEDVKPITVVTTPSSTPVATIMREHPTLPHFNNIVLTPGMNSLSTLPIQAIVATPLVQPQTLTTQPPPPPTQNIPNHGNNPSCMPSVHGNSQLQPTLSATSPPALIGSGISSPLSAPAVNSGSQLPFFNTIYGKLLDNHAPSITSPVTAPPASVPTIGAGAPTIPPSVASTGVLAEYLDTKLRSYNTLGGYVSHTALFGLNNTPTKDTPIVAKDASNEMPAPPVPQSAPVATVTSPSLSLTLNAASSTSTSSPSANVSAMKILTKTASHDPRLNPHLTAPEPPPQPKRKLSINEYRKRMQQTSSNDSASNSLASTPTTPPTPMETTAPAGPIAVVINKCTLNSPEHLTQSVDSQIQKEIIASSSLNVYDSLNSSNSSSTSNSSTLNETLLKSSSIVEEDSTKGQFNAAPTLLEKQQESLCARLKSLKEKQGLGGGVSRSRFSSFSESVGSIGEYSLRKDDDDLDLLGKRNHSISSSIGGGDLLDNCLEEISSTSTSMSSSREPSPERYNTSTSLHGKHVLTASATTTMTTTSSSSSGGQIKQQQAQHHNSGDKNTLTANVERKKSVDIA